MLVGVCYDTHRRVDLRKYSTRIGDVPLSWIGVWRCVMYDSPVDDQEYLHFKGQELVEKLEAEITRLKDFARGRGMVSEAADMVEVAVLVCGLHDKIARLKAELRKSQDSMSKTTCKICGGILCCYSCDEPMHDLSLEISGQKHEIETLKAENAELRKWEDKYRRLKDVVMDEVFGDVLCDAGLFDDDDNA